MSRFMKRLTGILVVIAIVTVSLSATAAIRIGLLLPLTGPAAEFGSSARDGAELAIAEWNERGGVLGHIIETIKVDTSCDPQIASKAAEKFIDYGANFIVGGLCPSPSVTASEVANSSGALMISLDCSLPAVTVASDGINKPYVFRMCYLDDYQARAVAEFAIKEVGACKAAILYSEYATGIAMSFKEAFLELGGEVPIWANYPLDTCDFTAWLVTVADADVDVIFCPYPPSQANRIGAQAKGMGLRAPLLGIYNWQTEDLDCESLDGAYFSAHYSLDDPRPVASEFFETFAEKFEYAPNTWAVLAYDAVNALLWAIKKAGTGDPEVVKDALAELEFEGVSGFTKFDEHGDPVKEVPIHRVDKDDGFVLALPPTPVASLVWTGDAAGVAMDWEPVDPQHVFPQGMSAIYTTFDYEGMSNGMAWGSRWYRNGDLYQEDTGLIWNSGSEGSLAVCLADSEGGSLPPGDYRVEILIEEKAVLASAYQILTAEHAKMALAAAESPSQMVSALQDAFAVAGLGWLLEQEAPDTWIALAQAQIQDYQLTVEEVYCEAASLVAEEIGAEALKAHFCLDKVLSYLERESHEAVEESDDPSCAFYVLLKGERDSARLAHMDELTPLETALFAYWLMGGQWHVHLGDSPGSVYMATENGTTRADGVVIAVAEKPNYPPTANAGLDQGVYLWDTVRLDGSSSSDPDGDSLSYRWYFISKPAGSRPALAMPNSVKPSFGAYWVGVYTLELMVDDSRGVTDSDEVRITVVEKTNRYPTASAGPYQSVAVGDTVRLDGSSSSDPDGDSLSYRWYFISKPAGSIATLSNPRASRPTFVADQAGRYTLKLTVKDERGATDSNEVKITSQKTLAYIFIGDIKKLRPWFLSDHISKGRDALERYFKAKGWKVTKYEGKKATWREFVKKAKDPKTAAIAFIGHSAPGRLDFEPGFVYPHNLPDVTRIHGGLKEAILLGCEAGLPFQTKAKKYRKTIASLLVKDPETQAVASKHEFSPPDLSRMAEELEKTKSPAKVDTKPSVRTRISFWLQKQLGIYKDKFE